MWDGEDVDVSERRAVFSNALANVSTEKMGAMPRIGTRLDICLCSREGSRSSLAQCRQWWFLQSSSMLASYLEERSIGGPIAASQVLAGMRWLNRYVGSKFATEHRYASTLAAQPQDM